MNILVLTSMAPFVWGGAEELGCHLVANLKRAGHTAELMRIPFTWDPYDRLIDEVFINKSIQLWNVDRVIALRFPAYLVPHHAKTIWLVHQYRQAYDLFDAGQSNIPTTAEGDAVKAYIKAVDEDCFTGVRRMFTISSVVSSRLKRYHGLDSEVVEPPINDPDLFIGGNSDNYILATGRVNAGKRQHLLVEAMQHLPRTARLVVAGPPDTPGDAEVLRRSVERLGLEDRVRLDLRFLPRAELASLVNNARAVAYLPYDEDSVGYVTMEAFQAGKPVITVKDSGGLLRIVRHEETGLVVDAEREALAQAMASLIDDQKRSERLGRAGRDLWLSLDINWPATVRRLLS